MDINKNEEEYKESVRFKERQEVIKKWGQALSKRDLAILIPCSKSTLTRRLNKLLPQLERYGYSKYDKLVSALIIDLFFKPGYCNRNRPDNP